MLSSIFITASKIYIINRCFNRTLYKLTKIIDGLILGEYNIKTYI